LPNSRPASNRCRSILPRLPTRLPARFPNRTRGRGYRRLCGDRPLRRPTGRCRHIRCRKPRRPLRCRKPLHLIQPLHLITRRANLNRYRPRLSRSPTRNCHRCRVRRCRCSSSGFRFGRLILRDAATPLLAAVGVFEGCATIRKELAGGPRFQS